MILYKFRPFEQLEYILDIVINERLYCAEYKSLNDPFEGTFQSILAVPRRFTVGSQVNSPLVQYFEPRSVEDLSNKLDYTRVCSLSSDLGNSQLWSLYAGGHTGVAIEIDFGGLEGDLHRVEYENNLPMIKNSLFGEEGTEKLLRTKTKPWAFEAEYRLVEDTTWYPVPNRIKRIIVGHRVSGGRMMLLGKLLSGRVELQQASLDFQTARVRA